MGKPRISILYGAVLRDAGRRLGNMTEAAEELEAVFGAPSNPDVNSVSEGEIAVTAQFAAQMSLVKEHLVLLHDLLRRISSVPASGPEAQTVAHALSQVPSTTVEDLMGRRAAIDDVFGKKERRG